MSSATVARINCGGHIGSGLPALGHTLFLLKIIFDSRRRSLVSNSHRSLLEFEIILMNSDQWFENGAISVAIKNPYKRIDTTAVSRHVIIRIDGEEVAITRAAVLLNETGLPEVFYIPATSIKNWGTIEKSDLKTVCPYKGEAS
jgi:hypothetical protein